MDKLCSLIPSIVFSPIDINNIVLSTLLGLIVSAGVSYWFFKLSSGPEKIASYLSHEIALMNLKQQLPQFFSPQAIQGAIQKINPPNSDYPILTQTLISPINHSSVEILCSVKDEKWNFPTGGITIASGAQSGTPLRYVAFGYWIATIANLGAVNGKHTIRFRLCDNENNETFQDVTF